MKPTLNEKFIAYLTLICGLSISAVAVYYSVVGLTAIFAAAAIPIIVMGTTLELGKLIATLWLKQNWKVTPTTIKAYLMLAILVLMIVTSMGIFGFLSKAHSDQNLVSGDVQSKIAVYDEKIKTAKENIDVNRKQLKQMDEAVDQIMGRSKDEKGAAQANAVRRSQARDRASIAQDIETNQKIIASLNDEAAPIRAEVRKVEAEVGPIKYIAAFFYGNTDPTILEKAVTWVIITLIVVFDPLAIILLLASQISFQNFRDRKNKDDGKVIINDGTIQGFVSQEVKVEPTYKPDDGQLTDNQLDQIRDETLRTLRKNVTVSNSASKISSLGNTPEEDEAFEYIEKINLAKAEELNARRERERYQIIPELINEEPAIKLPTPITRSERPLQTKIFKKPEAAPNAAFVLPAITEKVVQRVLEETSTSTYSRSIADGEYVNINGQTYHKNSIPAGLENYIQNEEQKDSNLWSSTKKE